jgi:hypothetical protein
MGDKKPPPPVPTPEVRSSVRDLLTKSESFRRAEAAPDKPRKRPRPDSKR